MIINDNRGLPGIVRREMIRAMLERIQGAAMKIPVENKSEIKDPKASFEVEEILNNLYVNRIEYPLAMDIFKPVMPEEKELPVIVSIHGGGLIMGDRKSMRRYARVLAGRGYLVFSIEYRLAPRANLAEQLDDVCVGMDAVGRRLVDFNVDFTRMFLTAESAGAILAIYVAAMKKSRELQEAIGYEPTRMTFKALGLTSGMFYTRRLDPIGWILSDQFYGEKRMDPKFLSYMDPENPEIVGNLPPTFLITSRGDFLNNYSLMYHRALKQAGRKSHLVYYGEKELGHTFVTTHPDLEQSLDAINRMTAWFEKQADLARENAAVKNS